MNLKEQEYMLALGRTRSLTRAAQELCITQPTLSVFLNNLEQRLKTPLFARVGKKLIPTAAGTAYLAYAQKMELLKLDFEVELDAFVKGRKGTLQVGSLRHRDLYLMPRLIRSFQEQYPGISVVLHEDTPTILENMLRSGELDLVLTNQPVEDESLAVQPIYEDRLLIVLSAARAALTAHNWRWEAGLPYLDLRMLSDETFYLLDGPRSIRILADQALRYAGLTPQNIQSISNIEIGCQMAAEGLGAAFTMESYHCYFHYTKPTKCFVVGDPKTRVIWNAVWRQNAQMPAHMDDFLHLLQEQMRDVRLQPGKTM